MGSNTMACIEKSLLVLKFTALVLVACVSTSFAREGPSSGNLWSETGQPIRLAASDAGQRALIQERNIRDALINDPPFTYEEAAPPPQNPPTIPAPVQGAYIPAPAHKPAAIPEMLVRGYSMDPSGAINTIGMDGVVRTVDGSRPIKLVFPPEYGLPPKVVGGVRPAPPPPQVSLAEIAVRGYSVDPSGAIIIIGMDGVIRVLDGSNPVKLVFPPEYGLAPQIVGGGSTATTAAPLVQSSGSVDVSAAPAEVQASGTGNVELPVELITEGVGALLKQINKGKSKRSR